MVSGNVWPDPRFLLLALTISTTERSLL